MFHLSINDGSVPSILIARKLARTFVATFDLKSVGTIHCRYSRKLLSEMSDTFDISSASDFVSVLRPPVILRSRSSTIGDKPVR